MQRSSPVIAVGAVIWHGPDRLLLIRRGQPPRLDEWSLPGGRVEFGETLRKALGREIEEETGLTVAIGALIDVVDLVEQDDGGLQRPLAGRRALRRLRCGRVRLVHARRSPIPRHLG